MMTKPFTSAWALGGLSSLLLSVNCGGRPAAWDAEFDPGTRKPSNPSASTGALQARGLQGSVAVLDSSLNRVLMLTSPRALQLSTTALPVGHDVVRFESSIDRRRLFVLSRGVTPRYTDADEEPQLRVFDGGMIPRELQRYALKDPYDDLDIDPEGEWLILRGSAGVVSNPNELLLVPLLPSGKRAAGALAEPIPKTLDGTGGKPVRVTFTGQLSIPGAEARRLLIVEREHDLAILDLSNLDAPEIIVGLPTAVSGDSAPLEVVAHDGVSGEVNSVLAVQLKNDSNVYLLTLNASTSAAHAFSISGNVVEVGGIPSKLDFVQTRKNGGLRLAALVPDKKLAKLVDPSSGAVQEVALPAGFSKIRRVTSELSENSGQDVALLYGATNSVAFWRLGNTVGTPYASIDAYDLGIHVNQVLDIPGDKFADRKILSGSRAGATQQFYVLDLAERKSFPLDVLDDLTLNISPNGEQLWAFGRDNRFAQLTFDPLQPASLYTQRAIVFVHDLPLESDEQQRTALALHLLESRGRHSLSATVFDGLKPNTARTKFYSNLELEGIQ